MKLITIEIDKFDGWFMASVFDSVTGELLAEHGEDTLEHAIARAIEKVPAVVTAV